MKQFKQISAVFKAKDKNITFLVERRVSGASNYGDRSAHTLKVDNNMSQLFDTRYDGISTDKQKWITFWECYILNNYLVTGIELESYSEKMIETD